MDAKAAVAEDAEADDSAEDNVADAVAVAVADADVVAVADAVADADSSNLRTALSSFSLLSFPFGRLIRSWTSNTFSFASVMNFLLDFSLLHLIT